jgi:hypothetical protein
VRFQKSLFPVWVFEKDAVVFAYPVVGWIHAFSKPHNLS